MVLRCTPCSPTLSATDSREHVISFSEDAHLRHSGEGRRSHSRSTTAPPPWPKAMRLDLVSAEDSPKPRTPRSRPRDLHVCRRTMGRNLLVLAVASLVISHVSWSAHLAARERRYRWRPMSVGLAAGAAGGIPKIIHQMYRTRELPPEWADVPAVWEATHPDYTYILWTDDTLRELIALEYPWLLPTYDSYPYDTQRWDASRYAILHKYGGLYVDLDLKPSARVDAMIRGQTLLLPHTPNVGLTNAMMASVAAHPFLREALNQLPQYAHAWYHVSKHNTVLSSTGSTFVWAMFMRWSDARHPVSLVPAEDWGKCSVCGRSCRAASHPRSSTQRVGGAGEATDGTEVPPPRKQAKEWAEGRQFGHLRDGEVAGGSENAEKGFRESDAPASGRGTTSAAAGELHAAEPLRSKQPAAASAEGLRTQRTREEETIEKGVTSHARQTSEKEPAAASAGEEDGFLWLSPFDHGRGSSWHSWDSALVLFLFCKINYLIVFVGVLAVYARTKKPGVAAAVALAIVFCIWLNHLMGLSVFEGLLCRPWIWLIMS
mmetsp:Transcript_20301/g.48755  ORF Transcript_20301/g.48755 Transcript_20301/m.48755 type:complete len:545 (-) Transcript_20301:400-2034(-)